MNEFRYLLSESDDYFDECGNRWKLIWMEIYRWMFLLMNDVNMMNIEWE